MTKTIIAIILLMGITHAESTVHTDTNSDKMIYNPYRPLAEQSVHYGTMEPQDTLSKPHYPANTENQISSTKSK